MGFGLEQVWGERGFDGITLPIEHLDLKRPIVVCGALPRHDREDMPMCLARRRGWTPNLRSTRNQVVVHVRDSCGAYSMSVVVDVGCTGDEVRLGS